MGDGKGTVLVVEDDTDLAGMISSALESAGFETIECPRGSEALERMSPEVDTVLLDRFLPDMNGDEVLARIEADPALREIPVIVMSVDGDRKWIARLLDGGAVDYIVKPVRLDILRARVAAAVRAKRRRERLREEEGQTRRIRYELESIYDSLQEGLMLIDREYEVRRLNRAMLEFSARESFLEAVGQACYRVFYGRESVCECCPVAEAVSSGGPAEGDCEVETPMGRRIHHTVAIPMGDETVVSVEDVTERRWSESKKARDHQLEALSRLAGASSHEINQPLGVISGRAQLMLMRLADAPEMQGKLQRDIDEILSATRRIEELVERLHNITDYVTKPYVGGREILDVEKSTRRFERREPDG